MAEPFDFHRMQELNASQQTAQELGRVANELARFNDQAPALVKALSDIAAAFAEHRRSDPLAA